MTEAVKSPPGNQSSAIVRRLLQIVFGLAIIGGCLFLAAWTLRWPAAWVYLALYVLGILINMVVIDRELIAERSRIGENTKDWDRRLSMLSMLIMQPVTFIVAGLDHRFGWTEPYSFYIVAVGFVIVLLAQLLVSWALAANRFFAVTVRLQEERDHEVITTGPYAIIRHPGYVGLLWNVVGAILLFNTLWAFIPFALGMSFLIARTALEDRTLQQELTGYREYTQQTRYRLFPGIW